MTHSVTLSALLLFAPAADEPKAPRYPRAELLTEATELAKPDAARDLRVLDARPREKYDAGHVPGAVWVDHAAWSKLFAAGQERGPWAKKIGEVGIDTGTPVVVYDDAAAKDAARIWWILRYWGVKDVRLLNGGWGAWQAAGGAVGKDEPKVTATTPSLRAQGERLASKDDVLGLVKGKGKDVQIIDARSAAEHCGDEKLARRSGAIPGAVNLDWTDLVEKKSQRFKGPEELARLFKEAGIDVSKPAVAHCQSGGRSSVMIFAMELMGAKDVRNYYKSWAEWGNDPDTPIVTPKPKK
jgi:thiosulfate/3-mercaptopyruvate sulfurtransferase